MVHKTNGEDVLREFRRFTEIAAYGGEQLERDGASWRVTGGPQCLDRWLYGAAMMALALRCYCDGFEAARKEVQPTR